MNRKKATSISRLLSESQKEFDRYHAKGDFESALAVLKKAERFSDAVELKANKFLCLLRLGRLEEALRLSQKLPGERLGSNFADLVAELHGRLGQLEESRRLGGTALQIKAQSVAANRAYPLPEHSPPTFSSNDTSRNIVAFSLFGDKARYCETAIMNCDAVARMLPGWTCRFYCDETVPQDVRGRLVAKGGEVVMVDATQKDVPPLMWRFLVADDPQVVRFLVRDADSLIGGREKALVEAWLVSGKWFHLIRDWYTHSELILAGLWGGCRGVLPQMRSLIAEFVASGDYSPTHMDQHFLRQKIWPTLCQSLLAHDSQFDFAGVVKFEPADDSQEHIGANLSAVQIGAPTAAPDGSKIRWTLYDDGGAVVCAYTATVKQAEWRDHLPTLYADNIEQRGWTVRTELLG